MKSQQYNELGYRIAKPAQIIRGDSGDQVVSVGPTSDVRITEALDTRITQDGDIRILE